MARTNNNIIASMDIGTTKVSVVVGEMGPDGVLHILGEGSAPSHGLKEGEIKDIEKTAHSIQEALNAAEDISGYKISRVYVGIAGGHITGVNSNGIIKIHGNSVTDKDMARVLESAKALAIPPERKVIHVLPQEYTIDDQRYISNPLGMAGTRLTANVHIITGRDASIKNIMRACEECGLEVEEVVLESLASAHAVLSPSERKNGVILIDMGGGTSDILIIAEDAVKYTGEVPMGGEHMTNDIVRMLRASREGAELIKIRHGCVLDSMVQPAEQIEVPEILSEHAPHMVQRSVLAMVCQSRMEEIFSLIEQNLNASGFKEQAVGGVVLTGGASLIRGCRELAEDMFGMPARIGYPVNVGGMKEMVDDPKFSTVVGLLRYGAEQERKRGGNARKNKAGGRTRTMEAEGPKTSERLGRWFRALWQWIKDVR
ncbi:MAG: cell division protein FtsA [Deltaproteobacteria bacterium]|jgi:cell division protein FtsA|nr:cell division protein FtsA [Deltaproteobacteria bacterium]